MFQPGEEGFHGARFMLDEGLLDQSGGERPSGAFALHITTLYETGTIDVRAGPMLASADTLRITVRGRGGHASTPHTARRPDRRRRRDRPRAPADGHPARRRLRSGGRHDRPGRGRDDDQHHPGDGLPGRHDADGLGGTARARSRPTSDGSARASRPPTARRSRSRSSRATRSRSTTTRSPARPRRWRARSSARSAHAALPAPIMGAEDFSYVLQQVPGAMAFVGARPPEVDAADGPDEPLEPGGLRRVGDGRRDRDLRRRRAALPVGRTDRCLRELDPLTANLATLHSLPADPQSSATIIKGVVTRCNSATSCSPWSRSSSGSWRSGSSISIFGGHLPAR